MKNILIAISAGIAAYKIPALIRLLKKDGHQVRCVLSKNATHFISPTTLQALSGERVRTALFDPESEQSMSHIELARWADILLFAPATANTIAKLSHGIADNLLSTLYLATTAEIFIAPAMNEKMWTHPATQENLQKLKQRKNHHLLPVGQGEQACGDIGMGRMLEIEEIHQYLKTTPHQDLKNKKILISAGPTREAIDPVRYISNHSSGKMGYALAEAAQKRGAETTLITGPVALLPPNCRTINIESALEMQKAVLEEAPQHDIFISAAAIADYRPKNQHQEKHKKSKHGILTIELIENPDILKEVAALKKNRPYCVGFAAESEALIAHAREKRIRKNIDLILANNIKDYPFGGKTNQITLIDAWQEITLPPMDKNKLADKILDHILQNLEGNHAKNKH